ncbi:hypothetical protein J6590_102657 [Homalodisca vitripennis]|nr:hypothetical protein J6590_102657 [Homalodisca vitripennis]
MATTSWIRCYRESIQCQCPAKSGAGRLASSGSHCLYFVTDGHYQLDKVLPGEYTVSVPSEDWCWQTSKFRLTVSTEQVIGPTFVQTGLPINFVSSHVTKVYQWF